MVPYGHFAVYTHTAKTFAVYMHTAKPLRGTHLCILAVCDDHLVNLPCVTDWGTRQTDQMVTPPVRSGQSLCRDVLGEAHGKVDICAVLLRVEHTAKISGLPCCDGKDHSKDSKCAVYTWL